MRAIAWACMLVAVGALCLTGCSTAPKTAEQRTDLNASVRTTLDNARRTDPGIQAFIDKSAGYAVLPAVGKGAFVVGGAFGRGELIQSGQMVGYCTVTQASVGLAAGGQEYSELIFFQTPAVLDKFKAGEYTLSADVSAVALKAGAAATANFVNGLAVFTLGQGGLMVEASVAGQKFSFQPVAVAQNIPAQPTPTP